MLRIISYMTGCSGNFLSDFLITNAVTRHPQFRIDTKQNAVVAPQCVMLHAGCSSQDRRIVEFNSDELILQKLDEILKTDVASIITHYPYVSKLKDRAPVGSWVKKIYPETNVFGAIKNLVFKKQEADYTSYQYVDELYFKVDHVFNAIAEYYNIITTDTDINEIIDFGKLYDIEFLIELYFSVNGVYPDKAKIEFAEKYIALQFPRLDDSSSKDFAEIVKTVNPQDYFDIAVCLFIYERNHNTIDKNRLWLIDDLPNTIAESLEFLQNNCKNYRIPLTD